MWTFSPFPKKTAFINIMRISVIFVILSFFDKKYFLSWQDKNIFVLSCRVLSWQKTVYGQARKKMQQVRLDSRPVSYLHIFRNNWTSDHGHGLCIIRKLDYGLDFYLPIYVFTIVFSIVYCYGKYILCICLSQ